MITLLLCINRHCKVFHWQLHRNWSRNCILKHLVSFGLLWSLLTAPEKSLWMVCTFSRLKSLRHGLDILTSCFYTQISTQLKHFGRLFYCYTYWPSPILVIFLHLQTGLTHNQANFTVMIIVATGHHGSHCVIDYSHNVKVKVLQRDLI